MLPIALPEETVYELMGRLQANLGSEVTVNLENHTITGPGDFSATFTVDDFRRHCLLNGLDDIGLTLQHEADITTFEQKHAA